MSQQAFINLALSNAYLFPNAQAGDLGILTGTSNQSILVGVSNTQSVLKITPSNISTSNINLGINQANPAFPLDVNGDLNFSGTLRQGGVPYVGSQWSNNSSNVFILTSNVGIQKSNPVFPLDVNGDLNFSGTLRQGGVPYVGSQWSNNSSNVFLLTSNVGLGLSNPQAQLHLTSNLRVDGSLNINNGLQMPGISLTLGGFTANSTSALYATTSNLIGYSNQAWTGSNGVQLNVPGTSNDKISFAGNSGNNEVFSVTGDGTINFTNRLNMNGIVLTQRQSSNVNNLSLSAGVVKSVANDTQITTASISNSILFLQGATEALRIHSNNFVGVAKSNPAYPLDVTGDINYTGTLRKNGAPINSYIVLNPSTTRTYSQNGWQVMSLGSVSRSNNSTLWSVTPTATGLDTFTINTTGLYQISMRIFVGGGTLNLRYGFVVNNSSPSDSVYDPTTSVDKNNIGSCVFTRYFTASDVIRFIFYQNVSSATTTNLTNNSYGQNDIMITFLSP